MIKAIVYKSNSGFTKEYALMLSKKLVLPVYDIKEANKSLCKMMRLFIWDGLWLVMFKD